MEFRCVDECSQCCVEREYYPTKQFGKIGVLILPEEKESIEKLAELNKIKIKILPRIGVSKNKNQMPTKILAYQLMGIEDNGNTCPFLDTHSGKKSTHGGFPCKIYKSKPLACSAYPLIEINPISLDQKCKFCKECGTADKNLNFETESLLKIQESMQTNARCIWRYATGIGEQEDQEIIKTGWVLEDY
ncbi:MAG: YkgJ family cysteine cluster protein [Nitrosopumilus sp.]|nr:YkgJ family cysteine cluster protein [Nitrosopumilus sp.]